MKWFLHFLGLGSAVLYTLLVIIDNRIPDGIADNTAASEAHSNQLRLSAWGPYLPNRSPGQDRQASTTTHQQNEASRGPGQMVAALQEPTKAQQFNNLPTPHVRRAKKIGPRPAKKVQPSIASAARYRYETVASILDKALRP